MSRIIQFFITAIIAFGVGIGVGVLGLLWATGGISEPSRDTGEVVATLSLNQATATPNADTTIGLQLAEINEQLSILSTQVSVLGNTTDVVEAQAVDEATEMPQTLEEERALFRITEDESEARFYIDETLLGNEVTVVGTTRRVAGDIIVNFSNPIASNVGEIAINVRTLRTDNEFRDQSIRGQILNTSDEGNEFVIFTPMEISNISMETVAVGDTVTFIIAGNLLISGVSNPVTFDTSVTVIDEDRIEGTASTEINYQDYGITINPPPNVGNIGEVVTLELDFVALRVDEE